MLQASTVRLVEVTSVLFLHINILVGGVKNNNKLLRLIYSFMLRISLEVFCLHMKLMKEEEE